MGRKFQAVYEGGVLRPVEPLRLDEHQIGSVFILDDLAADEKRAFEAPERFAALADASVSLKTVRQALSKIPGSLDADLRAERDDR
jgi:predicted DNA-binding antitoxin AbrB/MazE fold protein